jgi:predicted transcriptional regulator
MVFYFPEKEHDICMATSNTPVLSDAQLAELEKLARAQERTVDEVLSEAVDRYTKEKQWEAVKQHGKAKSRELGLKESDVPRLIAESRQKRSR